MVVINFAPIMKSSLEAIEIMKKMLVVLAMVLFLAAFAMAQQPPVVTPTQPGIVTNQSTPGYYNGSSTTASGTVGSQGNWAPPAGAGLTPTYTGNVIGVLDYIPNYDVMGAHENGGRGCAGCHAPHNQARGNGGSLQVGYGAYTDAQGGLWGEDTSAILSNYSGGIVFNGGNSHHSGKLTWGNGITLSAANAWTDSTYTGVATCLSCHDGDVSQGAMMSGVSYEQTFGLLNGIGIGINSSRAAIALYGNNPIPTFLGTTATTPNGYA